MQGIRGEESLFYIKKNDIWIPVGCLTGSPFSEESQTIKTTTRENEGWTTEVPTNQSYSIELSGLVVRDDEDSGNGLISYRELVGMKRNRKLIEWKREVESGYNIDSGRAYIVNISDTDTVDEMISFTATLRGYGKPEESNRRIYILGDGERTSVYTHADEKTVIQTKDI